MERVIQIRFKSGHECLHKPSVDSEDQWWAMIKDITTELNKKQSGLFIANSPFGIHKLTDVEAIHFGDGTPPDDSPVPKLGFVKE